MRIQQQVYTQYAEAHLFTEPSSCWLRNAYEFKTALDFPHPLLPLQIKTSSVSGSTTMHQCPDLLQAYTALCAIDPKSTGSRNKQSLSHIMYPPYLPVSPTGAQSTVGNGSHLLSNLPPAVSRTLNLPPLRAGASAALWWRRYGRPTTSGTVTTAMLHAKSKRIQQNRPAKYSCKKWICLSSLIIRYVPSSIRSFFWKQSHAFSLDYSPSSISFSSLFLSPQLLTYLIISSDPSHCSR